RESTGPGAAGPRPPSQPRGGTGGWRLGPPGPPYPPRPTRVGLRPQCAHTGFAEWPSSSSNSLSSHKRACDRTLIGKPFSKKEVAELSDILPPARYLLAASAKPTINQRSLLGKVS